MPTSLFDTLFPFLGGIGIFLVGMMLLSDGLVAFGGSAMKHALARFTGTPLKAFVSGTLATVVAQSSSATTVTLIGFVSAGLITFSQAIGVLIGASLGNTATGWIVAGLGLKVNLGFYTLPLVGIGALLKLLGRGRLVGLGLAMAGFGLMFVGLNTLQDGMRGLSTVFNLAELPSGGLGARVVTMLVGLVLTAILQSSTAAIATTLTALHTDTINFDQAAALVVGAAIGTTLTGVLAAVGGTIYAKRTALAYILFNAIAGLIAIGLLPAFFLVIEWLEAHAGLDAGAMSLAAFHSLFIGVGVVLFLPFVAPFARLVQRLLPARGEASTQRLDDSLLAIPAVALDASQRSIESVARRLLGLYGAMLSGSGPNEHESRLAQATQTLDDIYDFVSRVQLSPDDERSAVQRVAQLHAIDHLMRFRLRLHDLLQARVDLTEAAYGWAQPHSQRIVALARAGLLGKAPTDVQAQIEQEAGMLTELSRRMRHELLAGSLPGAAASAHALTRTDAFRWLERIGHHLARVCFYIAEGRQGARPAP